ncbi:hypothetical protein Tco_1434329, partial [Tanacetum coccineum]
TQDVNVVGPSINTASTNVNTGSLNINNVSPTVTTAPLEATHADLFGNETEIDMSNITTTYLVLSTPNIRIHKDHLLDHVIGDVQSDEAAFIGVDVRYGGATTTVTGLEVGQGSGNIDKTPTMTQDSPLPRINTLRSDEGKIQGRHEHDMEFDFDLDATKDVSTSEKDVSTAKPVSTASAAVTTSSVVVSTAKDKGKAKMDESESETAQTKTKLQQEQEILGYEAAVRLQAKLEEEERQRIVRVHEATSSFNVEEWEDIQARVEDDEELVQRLQAKEREMYTKAEQARMLQLRGYSFDEIKNLFEITMRRVHTFVLMESEIEKTGESSKPAEKPKDKEEELSQEELQQMMIIVPEQGMNVEALQTKYPIIDWEIYTEGTRKYWKIIRVGNHTERFNSTEPTDDKEREIWVKLKRLFELDTDDELWKLQKHIHDLTWKLYDSCGVHHVSTEKGIDIYMLIEKEYPLSRGTLT